MLGSFGKGPPMLLAVESLRSAMQDSSWLAQSMLQWMSSSPTPWSVNREIGCLANDSMGAAPVLPYLRYDAPLSQDSLKGKLEFPLGSGRAGTQRHRPSGAGGQTVGYRPAGRREAGEARTHS